MLKTGAANPLRREADCRLGVVVVLLSCNPALGVDSEAVDDSEETRPVRDAYVCPGRDDSQVLVEIMLRHAALAEERVQRLEPLNGCSLDLN